MADHALADRIEEYYDACNSGDPDRMARWFAEDGVHYFTRVPPVRGARLIAETWARNQRLLQARWSVEHVIEQPPEACSEWAMSWVDPETGERRLNRGTEWFVFAADGRIREIRAYHHSDVANRSGELLGFDYLARGATTLR